MTTVPISTTTQNRKKVTTLALRSKKAAGEVISMLTAYDYPTALALDQAGIDVILVGDSLGMVVLGYENTLPVTMEDMLHHCKAVARGARGALLVGDMPFMSFQVSVSEAVRNAGRFLQEGGMDAVKIEGGRERLEAVQAITGAGIPVMGHLGLVPQSVNQLGGFRPQARQASEARRLIEDGQVLVDGAPATKASLIVSAGARIEVVVPVVPDLDLAASEHAAPRGRAVLVEAREAWAVHVPHAQQRAACIDQRHHQFRA